MPVLGLLIDNRVARSSWEQVEFDGVWVDAARGFLVVRANHGRRYLLRRLREIDNVCFIFREIV